jgi:8-oxo-dGTP pyrophosphatase MutT (NUDIX family)
MELNREVVTEAPRSSATVVLLRDDRQRGLEVFLLRRHTASAVLGGAYVFPGGKLDDEDCAASTVAPYAEHAQAWHDRLAEPDLPTHQAVGLYLAAVREVAEECGLRMLPQALVPWSRWITPQQPSVTNRRFDTRFFVAALPPGQEPVHDTVEAIESVWLTPRDALQAFWARDMSLAPPQIMTLVSLVAHNTVDDALALAHTRRPPRILPEPFDDADGVRTICYPGDVKHSVRERAFAGPTRLRFVDGRFEPLGGLQALLAPEPL